MILLLRGRGWRPHQIRDTLTAVFLGLGALGALVLVVLGTSGLAPDASAVAALVPLVAIGHVAGRPVFRHLATRSYEPVLTAALTVSALTGLAVAVL
jgi:hypothetical protein